MEKHDQNHNDWDGGTEVIKSDKLVQSVKDGNNTAVKYLLEQGEDPNSVDEVMFYLDLFKFSSWSVTISRMVTLLCTWP